MNTFACSRPSGRRLRVLVLSNIFHPTIGGAGVVAESMARQRPDIFAIVSPAKDYFSNPFEGWREFDRGCNFRSYRIDHFSRRFAWPLPQKLVWLAQFAFDLAFTRPWTLWQLMKPLRSERPGIVCVNTMSNCHWVPKFLKLLSPKIKVIFYLHGEEISPEAPNTLGMRLSKRSLRKADAVVAVSSFTKGHAVRCGIEPTDVTVISNGVDTRRFSPGPKDPEMVRRFALEGKKVLLCLARFDERKGQDMLIRAMPAILRGAPGTVLLLVGSGPERDRLVGISESLGIENSVIFAGIASDAEVVAYYRTADVYIMPNRTTDLGDTEGFGLVFLEAGACGKPVIGGNAGGVPDAVKDGHTGYLVNGRSTEEIAVACVRLLLDAALCERLGANGFENARNHTWEMQTEQFVRVCEALVCVKG